MVSNSIDTEVLIVGAGPVGSFAANECARHNLRWRLIEERSSQSEHSKAFAIFPRTLVPGFPQSRARHRAIKERCSSGSGRVYVEEVAFRVRIKKQPPIKTVAI